MHSEHRVKTEDWKSTMTRALVALVAVAGLTACAGATANEESTWQGKTRDAWIDGKIEASYALNTWLNPFEIDTRVEGGVVHLSGTVDSQIDKDLAEEIARGTDGVTEVENDLVVEKRPERSTEGEGPGFAQRVSDANTTARVKLALLANDSTEGLQIDVDTENGVVSLAGTVASAQESELAERIARNTDGVTDVENRLEVGAS